MNERIFYSLGKVVFFMYFCTRKTEREMKKKRNSRTFNTSYESPQQGFLPGFEHPFERELDMSNRWVVLSRLLPWDKLCNVYLKTTGVKKGVGRKPINPRIVLGAVIIKHILNLDDRETVDQISENIYMQYFDKLNNHTFWDIRVS
jgi:hypothetical protein